MLFLGGLHPGPQVLSTRWDLRVDESKIFAGSVNSRVSFCGLGSCSNNKIFLLIHGLQILVNSLVLQQEHKRTLAL